MKQALISLSFYGKAKLEFQREQQRAILGKLREEMRLFTTITMPRSNVSFLEQRFIQRIIMSSLKLIQNQRATIREVSTSQPDGGPI